MNISGANYLGAGQGDLAAATAAHVAAKANYTSALAVNEALLKAATAGDILQVMAPSTGGENVLNALTSAKDLADLVGLARAAYAIDQVRTPTNSQEKIATQLKLTDTEFEAFVAGLTEKDNYAGVTNAQYKTVLGQVQFGLDGAPDTFEGLEARAEAVEAGYDAALAAALIGQYGKDIPGIAAANSAILTALTDSGDGSDLGIAQDVGDIIGGMTTANAAQIAAAYTALTNSTTYDSTATAYSEAQFKAALAAAKVGLDGTAVADANIAARATALDAAATVAAGLVTGVGSSNGYNLAQLKETVSLISTYTPLEAAADNSAAVYRTAYLFSVLTGNAVVAYAGDGGSVSPMDFTITKSDYEAPSAPMGDDAVAAVEVGYTPSSVSLKDLQDLITETDAFGNALITRTDIDDSGSIAVDLGIAEVQLYDDYIASNKALSAARTEAIATSNALELADAAVTSASVSASGFAGADQVWLKGASGDVAVSAGADQIIGFSDVTAMDNAVTTAAASPTFAISGSKGDLEVKGAAATSMNFIGTGGTVAPSLTTTKTNELLSVTSSTTGMLTLDLTALTDLETATANGTGALSLQNSPETLATITTGAGADKMGVTTATEEDNEDTDEVETISAVVSTGAGNDTIVVSTTGAGTTSIDAGEGNDTVVLDTKSTDTVSIDLGDGSDTFELGALSNIATKTTVSGGDGVDTLVTNEFNWSSADYLILNSYVSGFEKLELSATTGTLDASKLTGFASIDFKEGSHAIEEVNGQTLILSSREEADEVEEIGLAAVAESTGDDLTATALGYDDSDADAIEFGGDLNVVVTGNSALAVLGAAASNDLALNGNNATVSTFVAELGDSLSIANAVISGDIVTLTANMSSLAMASKGDALNYTSYLNVTVTATELENLETITVRGAGNVTINGGTAAEDDAVLKTIDVSGMSKQLQVDGEGKETSTNQSTTTITGNANAAEEILLGGAKDAIVLSGSTAGAMDVVSGFTLVALKSDSESVNTALSDDITTASTFAFDEDANYGSLTEAVLELGSVAGGHIFHADGNTYLFDNIGDGTEYEDTDLLIELTGIYDLTLLADLINPAS